MRRTHGHAGCPEPGWPHRRHHPAGLAGLITLVQTVGTTLAARGQTGVRPLDLLGCALLAASGLALVGRYRAPVPALAVIAAATVGYAALGYPSGPTFVALVIAIVFAVKAGQRVAAVVVVAVTYAAWVWATGPAVLRALLLAAGALGLLALAEAARVGARYREQARGFREEQARVRAEQQRRRASEERLRIAQELHDVLGHHLSLINVQAGVGLHLMDSRPEQARAALGTIKQASAEALREVRSVLAALDPGAEPAPRRPAPGLDRLDELTVDAGLPVRATTVGSPRPVPAEVDRAAYRIVQEALTNVRRHAGAGASATVVIEYGQEELVVRVEDDGRGGERPVTGGGGISGMRERAAALGGSLVAGPAPGGGFRIWARLPLPAAVVP